MQSLRSCYNNKASTEGLLWKGDKYGVSTRFTGIQQVEWSVECTSPDKSSADLPEPCTRSMAINPTIVSAGLIVLQETLP